jgi:hypothetical protein
MLGSAFRFQDMQQPFSFYADSDGVTQHTLQPNLAALMQASGQFTESDRVAANESWTHVTFDNLGAEFDCPESTYRLRVYDQHFDSIDGEHVPGDITFDEAESRQHTAGQLVSLPKFFSYQFQFDRRPRMMSGGYNSEGRPFLTISKSPNVHLMGTINRNTQSDRMTTSLIAAANPRSAQMARGLNYKDHLPAVVLNDEHGKPIPGGHVEESWPTPANYEFIKSPGQQFFEFQVSLIIGFTPIAGEAFGLYELYTSLHYDKDAFGNELTDTDKLLVAIAAILPFIGFQGLKRGVRFLSKDVFPLLSETLTKSHDAIARLGSV